jgi:hypothetical protein
MQRFDIAVDKTTLCFDDSGDVVYKREIQPDYFVGGSQRYMEGSLCIQQRHYGNISGQRSGQDEHLPVFVRKSGLCHSVSSDG